MRLHDALAQIAEIHGHLTKAEVYRGLRSFPVALSGTCGLLGALAQERGWAPGSGGPLAGHWVLVALVSALVGSAEVAYNYVWVDDDYARRRTRRVLGQFLPCMVAGGAVTLGLAKIGGLAIGLLPGLWALLFALGLFAARPYLPRAIGWVALSYLLAGAGLLAGAEGTDSFSGWTVGTTFALGQTAFALVLYWNLERRPDPDDR